MEEKGNFSKSFFLRRYFYLMLFGLIHLLLLWGGDVLMLYSIAGFIVLMVRKVKVRYVLIAAVLILLCPLYGHIFGALNKILASYDYKTLSENNNYIYTDILTINLSGTFKDFLKFRLYEYSVYFRNVEYFPTLIALIFIGYSAGRYKFYNKIPESLKKLTPVAVIALPLVIIFRIYYNSLDHLPTDNYKLYVIIIKLRIVSNIAQSFLYLYLISLLYEKRILTKIIEPLAYAGRMSLTNYIMQSVVGLILFNGAFFALYGKLGLAWLEVIVICSYISLIIGSMIWFSKFRYGPLEWIWRDLTYKTSLKFIKNGINNSKS